MKKALSVFLMISLLLCCTAAGFPVSTGTADAANAGGYTLTSCRGETISAVPTSPHKISVIIFGSTIDSSTEMTLNSLSKSTLVEVRQYRFIFADLYDAPRNEVTAFANDYAPEISFCCGNYSSMMWHLIRDKGYTNVAIPTTILIDNTGNVVSVATGNLGAKEITQLIKAALGDAFVEPPKNPAFTTAEVRGFYYTNIQEALDRVNEIRYEACAEGVENPDTGKPLTLADYHPVRWSAALEEITRLRAAEATLRIGHTRPNGERCFTACTLPVNGVTENLAWNHSADMVVGINQFYSEKEDWINKTGGVTGHYTSMISPDYRCAAAAGFYSNCGPHPSCLCFWLSTGENDTDETFGKPTDTVSVPIEIESRYLSNPRLISPQAMQEGDSAELTFLADTKIEGAKGFVYLREDVAWESSDQKILTVENGTVRAVGGGDACITATAFCGLTATARINSSAAATQAPTEGPTYPAGMVLCGDADVDYEITILDATAIQRTLANLPTPVYNASSADADEDGEVTILDATAIQRSIAGLPANENIGEYIRIPNAASALA